jgi:hypothetical protein
VIEFEASGGPPHGRISVDGGLERAFYGWMDLTAQLEALMPDPGVTLVRSGAGAGQAPRG